MILHSIDKVKGKIRCNVGNFIIYNEIIVKCNSTLSPLIGPLSRDLTGLHDWPTVRSVDLCPLSMLPLQQW